VKVTVDTLKRFESRLREEVPTFKVAFKDQAWSQRLMGFFVTPFNPTFSTDFITTVRDTVYFPTQEYYERDPQASLVTLAHEFVHVWDYKQTPWFRLSYIFPQILVVVPILVYGLLAGRNAWLLAIPIIGYALACFVAKKTKIGFCMVLGLLFALLLGLGWEYTGWHLLTLLGLVVVAPWPAPWRTKWELRGYGMSISMYQWLGAGSSDLGKLRGIYTSYFVGPAYYFMSWTAESVDKNLEATRQQAEAGALQTIAPYSIAYEFLRSSGLNT